MIGEIKAPFNPDASRGRAAGVPNFTASSVTYLLIDFNEPALNREDRWYSHTIDQVLPQKGGRAYRARSYHNQG